MQRRRLLPFLFSLAGTFAAAGAGADAPVSEAAVKAAFVYNFAKFVEFPGESPPGGPPAIRLCLYGNRDPFLAALAEIDGKVAQNRTIRVQRVSQMAELRTCQILVVAESEHKQMPEALHAVQDAGTLTVSEFEGFADAGGTIGLVVDKEKVQFEVNLEAARRNNIKLSSQLLKLARRILR